MGDRPLRLSQAEDFDPGMANMIVEMLSDSTTTKLHGREIALRFPNDCHFLTSCPGFYPLDKRDFERICNDRLQNMYDNDPRSLTWCNGKKIGVRPLIYPEDTQRYSIPWGIMEVLNAHARSTFPENANARFRIWKAPKTLKQIDWEDALFEDVTDNENKVKEYLEGTIKGYRKNILDEGGGDTNANPIGFDDAPSAPGDSHSAAANNDEQNRDTAGAEEEGGSLGHKRSRAGNGDAVPTATAASSSLSPRELLKEAKRIVKTEFVDLYDRRVYQDAIDRLYADFNEKGNGDYQAWAKQFYCEFRQNDKDEKLKGLNMDRKHCLRLVYDLVEQWNDFCETHGQSEQFEQAMLDSLHRIENILAICLPMDRAQALYKMTKRRDGKGPKGRPWHCKLHAFNDEQYNEEYPLEDRNPFAHDYPEVKTEFYEYLDQFHYGGSKDAIMDKKLFRVLFCEKLNLLEDEHFRELAMPAPRPDDAD